MAVVTTVAITIVACTPGSVPLPPPADVPDFLIVSPADGAEVSAPLFFAVQALDPTAVSSIVFTANGDTLAVDDPGETAFRVFVLPSNYATPEIELTATVTIGGTSSSQTVTVTNIIDPPASATLGPDGAILGDEEASGATSTLSLAPGVGDGATVTFASRSEAEVLAETGVDYGALGVTFLGAQEIDSSEPLDGPVGISSGGFGPQVQPGQAVVNYTIGPDADGDGVGELIVINTATVAPNGDVISDPVPEVLSGSGQTLSASGASAFRTLQDGVGGPPGTTIEFEANGLNPYSVLGNEARFRASNGDEIAVPLLVLTDEETGEAQVASTVIPALPPGAANVTIHNLTTGSSIGPFAITIEATPSLPGPAADLIDARLAELAADVDAQLPNEVRDQLLDEIDALRSAVATAAASPSAADSALLTTLAQMLLSQSDGGSGALRTHARCDQSAADGLVATSAGIGGIGIGLASTDAAAGTALGAAMGTAGVAIVAIALLYFAGRAFGIFLVDGVGPAHSCPAPPPPCPSLANLGLLDFTGMGSAIPSGGPACGSIAAGIGAAAGSGNLRRLALEAGAFSVKFFVGGGSLPFSSRNDAGGYFMVPFIPEGQTFTAVATEIATGDVASVTGVGRAAGESQFLFFDFTSATAPTNVSWDGGGDGVSWIDPLNWSGDELPGPTDRVLIDVPGDLTVVHSVAPHTLAGLELHETLDLTGGTLDIAGPWSIEAGGRLNLIGGVLDGDGEATIDGDLVWSGSEIKFGGDLVVNGTMTIANDEAVLWPTRDLSVSGSLVLDNTAAVNAVVSAERWLIDILPGGTFDVRSDTSFGTRDAMRLRNSGTVVKSAGAGESFLAILLENLGGSVDAQSGTLSFFDGGALEGGSYHAAAGATLNLSNFLGETQFWTLSGTLTGDPDGTVQLRRHPNASFPGNSIVTVPDGGTAILDFGGEGFQWHGGIIDGPGTLRNEGLFVITGVESIALGATAVFDNADTVRHVSGWPVNNGASITNNLAGALYEVTDDLNRSNGTFSNAGTLRKSGGAGTANFFSTCFLEDGGIVEELSGTITIADTCP